MSETKTITVESTWRQVSTYEVPVDCERGDLGTLDGLMDLIRLDVNGDHDIQPDTAEIVDWDVS